MATQGGPVVGTERIEALDIIRGFAVLGILTMNITLGLPGPARLVPTIAGGFTGLNFAAWVAGFLLFDEKMITLFCMLYGAGIFLIGAKVPARLFVRRQAVLLAVGMIHAYLLWEGDILVPYALCGLIVYPLRNLAPRKQLWLALGLWLPSLFFSALVASVFADSKAASLREDAARVAGAAPWSVDVEEAKAWRGFHPDLGEVQRLVDQNRHSSWWQLVRRRAPETFSFQTMVFAASFAWTISARMLLGIALVRFFLLAGPVPPKVYLSLAIRSYWIGFPIVLLAMGLHLWYNFDPVYLFSAGLELNQLGSSFVAVGHACALLWAAGSDRMTWLLKRLAWVGRMALSNYLLQSLIATTLFYGYGLGQFGRWDRQHLTLMVLAIWSFQLGLSALWFRHFQFGPVEWMWRSATYGKWQPFRLHPRRGAGMSPFG
jgi:uncharacterized protein